MRKIIFILSLTALVTVACSADVGNRVTEKSADKPLEKFDESAIVAKINELDQTARTGGQTTKTPVPPPPASDQTGQTGAQPQTIELDNLGLDYGRVVIGTNLGDITIELYYNESPLTVNNFLNLARDGFYNGTKFHRVIPDFMIQGGDPNSRDDDWSDDGTGGPDYRFGDEINEHPLVRGSLAMANTGKPNSNGSQFFIVTKDATPWLDGRHTNFGQVVEGMDIVDRIEAVETNDNDHPLTDIIIEKIELIE